MAQLVCKNLDLGYENHVVLKDVNFSVNAGDYLCIVGENGSGKSTLMKTVLGLQKPLGGTITFGDGVKNNEIGYLPQQTQAQRDFPATVEEIVLSGCQGRSKGLFYSREEKQLARQNMDKMRIAAFAKRCYRELSGGQQQRVLLARALCATGKMLLLDEPVSGLDPKVTLEMYRLVYELNKIDGITVERRLCRKMKTTAITSASASKRVLVTSWMEASRKSLALIRSAIFTPLGSEADSRAIRASMSMMIWFAFEPAVCITMITVPG